MLNEIRDYLSACPHFSGMLININHLDSKAGAISLESSPQKTLIKEYTDGEKLYALDFTLAIRQVFSQSVSANNSVPMLCEDFSAWLEEQSCAGNLPRLEENLIPVSVLPKGSYYMASVSGNTSRYDIPFRLSFREACI